MKRAIGTVMLQVWMGICGWGQVYTLEETKAILTKNDGAPCDPQAGADYKPSGAGCCSSPGNRQCFFSCTAPDANGLRWNSYDNKLLCNLPTAIPEVPANLILPPGKPAVRDFRFFVTSDLHFYRVNYPIDTQFEHPSRMNLMHLQSAAQGKPYAAVIIPGDISTGPNEQRLGAYRTLYERGWLPGSSINLPVFFGLGNHDASARPEGFGAEGEDAVRMWDYLDARMRLQNLDTSPNGCLAGIDPFCLGLGPLAGSHNYSWDWHGVHMVMLNTWAGDTDRTHTPPFGMNGMEWLRRDLEHFVGNSGRPVILFQHYPLSVAFPNFGNGPPYFRRDNGVAFLNLIHGYNVIGLFTGHQHGLGTDGYSGQINQPGVGRATGLGNWLDDFNDGDGGDCGTKNCKDSTANFLSVNVTERYLDVSAHSWKPGVATYRDAAMGMGPEGDQASCRKRIARDYLNVDSQVSVSINNTGKKITISNPGATSLGGALVMTVKDGTGKNALSQWDFVNRCSSGGSAFVVITEGSLGAGQSIEVPFQSTVTASNVSVFRLGDDLLSDNDSPVVGNDPLDLQITTLSGKPVAFSISSDAAPWLAVSAMQTTTPATIRLKGNLTLSNYATTQAFITVTPADNTIAPLKIKVSLPPSALTVLSNVPNSKMLYDGNEAGIPFTAVVVPASVHKVDVPSPQIPSAGVRYAFSNWSNQGPKLQNLTLPFGSTTLTANFNTQYQLQISRQPREGGSVEVSSGGGPEYFASGLTTIQANANAGYFFNGYTGDVVSETARTTFDLRSPLNVVATFAPNPTLSIGSNFPSFAGASVSINGIPGGVPVVRTFAPGTAVTIAVPGLLTDAGNPGTRLVFLQWSDGITSAQRLLTLGKLNVALNALYEQQYLVSVSAEPANTGTVIGGGWFAVNAPITLQASALPGFVLQQFSGSMTSTANPLIFSSVKAENIVAQFGPNGSPAIQATRSGASQDLGGGVRSLPLLLRNSGPGGAIGLQIDSITDIQVVGGSGSVSAVIPAPVVVGTIPLNGAGNGIVNLLWPSTATRVRLTLRYSANGGSYQGSTILNLFR